MGIKQNNVSEHLEELYQKTIQGLSDEAEREIVRGTLYKYADTFSKDERFR